MFEETNDIQKSSAQTKKRVVIIGASGKKSSEYITAIMKRRDLEIVGAVINKNTSPLVVDLESRGVSIIRNGRIDQLLTEISFDIAVVSVPHSEHKVITQALLHAGKYVIKEKPLAMSVPGAEQYDATIRAHHILPVFTTVQRDSLPSFLKAKEDLHLIGQPLNFRYDYWFNLPSVTTGWRARRVTAGGGVVLDMGYHAIDVLIKFFGKPDRISASMSYKYQETEQEGLEDYAEISMEYTTDGLQGKLVLDRHADVKKESFTIHGSHGYMVIQQQGYHVYNLENTLIKELHCALSKDELTERMFEKAIPFVMDTEQLNQDFIRNRHNVETIDRIYSCSKTKLNEQTSDVHIYSHSHAQAFMLFTPKTAPTHQDSVNLDSDVVMLNNHHGDKY
ncbi:MAG: Gfo/Idh/MocA family oxidoreductase [Legionellaceae bacterium]|nr:Gfo/Idh/MocA family oxidoreductase [Legionellaceae bacterium]